MQSNCTVEKGGLNADEVTKVREMLLIGLASYGEIMRLQNAADIAKTVGQNFPVDMRPIDPTGSPNTVCEFADALRSLEHAEVLVRGKS